jgi:hypothetical protein
MNKRKFLLGFSIFVIILLSSFLTSYTSSTPQTTQYSSSLSKQSESFCEEGSDFVVQISPFECSPAIVRSDLLEENDVPVYCQLSATKINPLIQVSSVDSITLSGKYSSQVSGVAFHSVKSALSTSSKINSGTASLNNLGYVVIMLKKQSNESAMPDFVSGNLTAKLKYDIDTSFGIGDGSYYLPELSNTEFESNKAGYSFWNGKGFLQAENIESDSADISIYSTTDKISTVTLQKGKTSNSIYLPGFECQAGLKLTLQSISNPDTRARLRINSDSLEIAKGEKFLNNKCTVQSLNKKGLVQDVTIRCQEDSGIKTHSLVISPKVVLKIGGTEKEYSLGDKLYSNGDRNIYLGYVGTRNTKTSENLLIYLYSIPSSGSLEKLSDNQLKSISSTISNSILTSDSSSGVVEISNDALRILSTLLTVGTNYVITGEDLRGLGTGESKNLFGQDISIVGFAGSKDLELSADALELYTNANNDYSSIQESFAEETYSTSTYGESALYNQIVLAFDSGQKNTASSLCNLFSQNYPNSLKDISSYCNSIDLSNSEIEGIYITINKETTKVSFEGIYEPSLEDYGAYISIENAGDYSGQRTVQKGQKILLSETESISLTDLSENTATFDVSKISGTLSQDLFKNGRAEINLDDSIIAGKNKYKISLTQINLKKVAKVSVKSNIQNTGTQANFSFKIGIEKRESILAPVVIESLIGNISKNIGTWQNISNGLNTVNKVLKTSCISAGAALVVKNFILGTDGTAAARKAVMNSENGWSTICAQKVAAKEYLSLDQCYTDNSAKIDKDVSEMTKLINAQNTEIKQLQTQFTKTSSFGEKVIDTDKFMTEAYISTATTALKNSNIDSTLADPSGAGSSVDVDSLLTNVLNSEGYNNDIYSVSQLKEIELYTKVLSDTSASEELKNLAKENLYSTLFDIQSNAKTYTGLVQSANLLGIDLSKITYIATNEKSKFLSYEGLKDSSGNPIAYVQTSTGVYTVVLDNSAGTSTLPIKRVTEEGKSVLQIKDSNGNLVTDSVVLSSFQNIDFKQYTSSTYKNNYLNPKVSYYETEPYAGLPAIVPFDKNNGWYASVSQTLSIGNNIASYDKSGKVTSFWVCNIGSNGLEENKGGDDICEMINTGTGQPYNQFPGLSESEATSLIKKANQAIESASTAYSSSNNGKVQILGDSYSVGVPAANIPGFQCQDFMSPKECLLLFNLCDPVICSSSRCDLGGTYPVEDVIQTGIIGSIALCLPNVREGIIMPVCLTGVQSGIDGLISIQKSYRDCLNESLATGKTVGICDEIYSIYLCDFFWKQAIPVAKMIVPAILTTLGGQNVKGGGEYLNIASAWGTAEESVNYLVNYYGSNAKSAFTARTSELVQNEVCKLYTSATVPTGGDLLDTLIQSDSPAQYTARFDEIPLTTATNPATSQYKVYFHIYAGKDSGASYQVYLKGSSDSTYYKDTSQSLSIDSGYISVGTEVDKTKDIIANSGYKELCINVNGEEECGFKQVSTSFAINYVTETYVSNQANQTNIETTSDCISGTANIYSLLVNLNAQAAAESLINPAIYNQGIIRVCATADPGKGTDSYSGTENSRWKSVGYCDDKNIKCWIDTDSIKEVLTFSNLENGTLNTVSQNYNDILANEYGYLTSEEFDSAIADIENKNGSSEKVNAITLIINKVFLNSQKAKLLFLRGNAYADLLSLLLKTSSTVIIPEETETATIPEETEPTETEPETTPETVFTKEDLLKITDAGERMVAAANLLSGTIVPGTQGENNIGRYNLHCWTAVVYAYDFAEVSRKGCVYGDADGKKYTFSNVNTGGKEVTITIGESKRDGIIIADGVSGCTLGSAPTSKQKFDSLKPGYLLSILHNEEYAHSVIFLRWIDEEHRIAELFDWRASVILVGSKDKNGKECTSVDAMKNDDGSLAKNTNGNSYCKIYQTFQADLNDNANPVFLYWPPYLSSAGTTVEEIAPKQSFPTSSDINEESTVSITTPIVRNTTREKIYAAAMTIVNNINSPYITASAAVFVSNSLINAGISGMIQKDVLVTTVPSTVSSLISVLEKRTDFSEWNVNDLKIGDIVILGKGCNKNYSVGIVALAKDSNNKIFIYTNLKDKVKLETLNFVTSIDSGIYLHKAYRYTADTKETILLRGKWTLIDAIEDVNTRKGTYRDNQIFVDQLIFDGILTEKECEEVRTYGFLGLGQKDMLWLKKLLLSKISS